MKRIWILIVSVAVIRGLAGPALNSSIGVLFGAVSRDLGAGLGTVSLFVSVASLSGMLVLPAGGALYRAWGLVPVAACGALLVGGTYMLLGTLSSVSLWCLLAVPFGIGTALTVNLLTPLAIGASDSGRSGFYMGLVTACASLVGAVAHPLVVYSREALGWRLTAAVVGGAALALMLPALSLLRRVTGGQVPLRARGRSHRRSLPLSLHLALYGFAASMGVMQALHHHLPMLSTVLGLGHGEEGLSLAVSMAAGGIGALVLGHLSDRWGSVEGACLTLLVGALSVVFLLFGAGVGGFSLGCLLHGFALSGIGVNLPAMVRERCGEDLARELPRYMIATPLASVVAVPLIGALYDRGVGYAPALLGMLLLFLFALGLLIFCARKEKEPT